LAESFLSPLSQNLVFSCLSASSQMYLQNDAGDQIPGNLPKAVYADEK